MNTSRRKFMASAGSVSVGLSMTASFSSLPGSVEQKKGDQRLSLEKLRGEAAVSTRRPRIGMVDNMDRLPRRLTGPRRG